MKKTFILLLLTFITTTAFAQKPDKVLARVSYAFTHTRDTTQRSNPYTETMLLVIGKNASVYTSFDKINRDLDLPIANTEAIRKAPFKPVTVIDHFFFVKENKFYTRQSLFTNYIISEETPKIVWKIAKDTANLSGISCRKATTYYKGRNWTAWFAPALPFQSGPWKLNGLPGLIIEAYDEKKEVKFEIIRFSNLKENDDPVEYKRSFYFSDEVKFPSDVKATTRVEFDKLMSAFNKDPKGFVAAAAGTSVANIRVGGSITGESHKVINNPIELPEKK
jgi:GLPGLI family protein